MGRVRWYRGSWALCEGGRFLRSLVSCPCLLHSFVFLFDGGSFCLALVKRRFGARRSCHPGCRDKRGGGDLGNTESWSFDGYNILVPLSFKSV